MENQININKNHGTISIVDGQGVEVHINTQNATEIIQKLGQLQDAQLDALQQVAEKQTADLSNLFRTLLKGVTAQKNIVSGTISQVDGDVIVGDNNNNTNIFNFTYVNMTPAPVIAEHRISLSTAKNVSIEILERRYLLDEFQELIDAGHRYIVLHGSNGIGKTTFASLYYNAYSIGKYMQKAWFNFQGNLPETYVKELTDNNEELKKPSDIKEWKGFYYQKALREVRNLDNITYQHPNGKRLIIIDNVDNEQGITPYYDDLLYIKNTIFVFITQGKFEDERFAHFALPRLTDEEVRSILNQFLSRQSQDAYLKIINGNPFILSLMLKQSPREGERQLQQFADLILRTTDKRITEKDLQIVEALYQLNALNPMEEWLLLQFAALPNGAYDEVMLNQYWLADGGSEEAPTFEEVLELTSCQALLGQRASLDGIESVQQLLERLNAKGWLEDKAEEYELNSLMRTVFVWHKKNQYAYTTEIAECLRINFFTSQHNNLKDHLVYEEHLRHYLDFVEGVAHPKYLDALYKLVQWYEEAGAYYEELKYRQQHFALAQAYYGTESDFLIERETYLAWNYRSVGDLKAAKKHGENALDKAYRILSPGAPLTAKCESSLGLVLKALGDYAGAKVLLEKALRSDEANFGEDHPTTAMSYSNLALVLEALGDYAGAKVLLEKALRSAEANFGEDHPTTAVYYSNLGSVLKALGDYAGAKVLLEKALRSAEANFGEHHPSTAVYYSNLALVLKDLGDYAGARELLEKALHSDEVNLGENHPTTAVRYSNLAAVLQDLGDYAGAKVLLEKALRSDEANFGENHPTTAARYSNLALVLQALGDYAGAKVLLEKAVRSDEANFGEKHPSTAVSYSSLAVVLEDLKDYERALALVFKAYRICAAQLGQQHPNTKTVEGNLNGIANAMLENGWTEEAIKGIIGL